MAPHKANICDSGKLLNMRKICFASRKHCELLNRAQPAELTGIREKRLVYPEAKREGLILDSNIIP